MHLYVNEKKNEYFGEIFTRLLKALFIPGCCMKLELLESVYNLRLFFIRPGTWKK